MYPKAEVNPNVSTTVIEEVSYAVKTCLIRLIFQHMLHYLDGEFASLASLMKIYLQTLCGNQICQ